MIMGIDHGYYAIKTRHFSFPAGVTAYTHEPYTLKNTLQIGGKYYVCGTGRQPILRDKTVNDNYWTSVSSWKKNELRKVCPLLGGPFLLRSITGWNKNGARENETRNER